MSQISFQYLRDKDLGWLADASQHWSTYADALSDVHGDMQSKVAGAIVNSGWEGDASQSAAEICDELVLLFETRRVRASAMATVLSKGYDDISQAQTSLRSTILKAENDGLTVADDGAVSAKDTEDDSKVAQYQKDINAYLEAARDADDRTADALQDQSPSQPGYVAPDELEDIGEYLREHLDLDPPPEGGSADDNAQWWQDLSDEEREAYAYAYPEQIGFMDGVPSADRHVANMVTLRQDAQDGHDTGNAQELLDRVEKSQYGPDAERIFLLGYEPPGADGSPDAKVIAATGNPDTADNVAVFVPGVSTDLGSVDGNMDRLDDLRSEAEMVPGSGSTSTILWLGYDPPDTIPGGIMPGPANDAAPDLVSFTEGLRETHTGDSPAHNTVIGHSYGSTVVGTADASGGQGTDDGLHTDDIIVLGSPGLGQESPERQGFLDGPMVDDVSDLHIAEDHFWAGAAGNDMVSYTQVHGNSPVDWSFGGQRISTEGASGHSEYWDPDTESLRNQAYIVTGEYDQVDFVNRRFG